MFGPGSAPVLVLSEYDYLPHLKMYFGSRLSVTLFNFPFCLQAKTPNVNPVGKCRWRTSPPEK